MKTNQLMNVAFSCGNIRVFHNTAMGSLTDLWTVGNSMRIADGKSIANMAMFLKSSKTIEFMEIIKESIGGECINLTGKGNKKETWANIHFMIYAAEYLSPKFHFEVIDSFVNNKILEWRDVSGDEFKALNMAIDSYLPEREGKSNKGIYINVAKMMLQRVNPEIQSWNQANADDLRCRAQLENKISTVLELGLVSDWEHLKELILKIKV